MGILMRGVLRAGGIYDIKEDLWTLNPKSLILIINKLQTLFWNHFVDHDVFQIHPLSKNHIKTYAFRPPPRLANSFGTLNTMFLHTFQFLVFRNHMKTQYFRTGPSSGQIVQWLNTMFFNTFPFQVFQNHMKTLHFRKPSRVGLEFSEFKLRIFEHVYYPNL